MAEDVTKQLRAALAKGDVVIGSRAVGRGLKAGGLKLVLLAANAPAETKADMSNCAKLSGVQLEISNMTAKQLGTFCGKPFAIAAIAIR